MIINKSDCHKWLYIKVIVTSDYKFSSNINEVIRPVLNFLFFFTKRFHKHKKAQNRLQQTKIKNLSKKDRSSKINEVIKFSNQFRLDNLVF